MEYIYIYKERENSNRLGKSRLGDKWEVKVVISKIVNLTLDR